MKITIHRGASQIGGCVTEIQSGNTRILIDFGSNLPGSDHPDFSDEELRNLTDGVDAIFYTHMHGDHVGHMAEVDKNIPQFIGPGAKEVMLCKYRALAYHDAKYKEELAMVAAMKTYKHDIAIDYTQKKGITVTPYYCSHSAFDSYMFKIECEKKTILHTGDFRVHGYMGGKLISMLEKYVGSVDVLITEGTMLSRNSELVKKENDVKNDIAALLREHKCVLTLCSSTDLDRLASLQEACRMTNHHFVVDNFQHQVLQIFNRYTRARLYKFLDEGLGGPLFRNIYKYGQNSILAEKVVNYMKRRGFLMPVRMSHYWLIKEILEVYADFDPVLVYSMWNGYYKGTDKQRIKEVEKIRALFPEDCIFDIHTSGHADCETLAKVCMTVKPRLAIIPIHKDEKSDFRTLNISQEMKNKVITETTTVENIEITIK